MEDSTKKIVEMVQNHFNLKSSSNFRFKGAVQIRNMIIDPLFKDLVDENYRITRELPIEAYSIFDKGWNLLKEAMPFFIEHYGITYDDFRKNKIIHEKNTLKIIKLIKSYFINTDGEIEPLKMDEYIHLLRNFIGSRNEELRKRFYIKYNSDTSNVDFFYEVITSFIDSINEVRFSTDKNMSVVVSFNFKDIFLSSTGEDWSSCLNLESRSFASYWASLPGAAVDRNFGILYITNGSEKYYNGIVAPKVIARSFILLDENDEVNVVKFYPNEIIDLEIIKKMFPFKIKNITSSFKSKYNIYPLKYKNDLSCYVYQDKTEPVLNEDGSFYLKYGGKGLFTIIDNEYFEGPIFNFTGGFQKLKDMEKNLGRFVNPAIRCSDCGKLVSGSRAKFIDDEPYCENHYESQMEERVACMRCGDIIFDNDDIHYDEDGIILCPTCYDED